MGKLGKKNCSIFFCCFFFLGHLLVGEEFKSTFADPVEQWYGRTLETSVSFGSNFLCCKLKREGSQRGWKERGLFLEVSVNCDRSFAPSSQDHPGP